MNANKTTTNVIKIGDRYFHKFGLKNRVCTAWSLSGAATYQLHDLDSILDKLVVLGKRPVVVRIGEI